MKTLGLIGGTSWHSTIEYYRYINTSVNAYFGNNTNPPLLIYTLNQAKIHRLQIEGNWDAIATMLIEATRNLHKAGSSSVMFCANTPHKVYDIVEKASPIPIIHIVDATAKAILKEGLNKVGFIGTKFSMESNFIKDRLSINNIDIVMPRENTVIMKLHRIIQKELTYGNINKLSKKYVIDVFHEMTKEGAQGLVLGCTEFPLMINQKDVTAPIFNTTELHSMAAVNYILGKDLSIS